MKVNLRQMAMTGLILMATAAVFAFAETIYYGSNMLPGSRAEAWCDYMAATLDGAGIGLLMYAFILETVNKVNKLLGK